MLLGSSLTVHAQTGEAIAIERVRTAILNSITATQSHGLQIHIRLSAPRGAALRSCNHWQWGAINASSWKRIHIPVQCDKASGSWAAKVRVTAPVWTASSTLYAGQTLQPEHFQVQLGHVERASDLLTMTDWLHMQLRKDLSPQHVLRLSDLERPVYARKGDVIEIRVNHEDISVSTQGIASHKAYKGGPVKARNMHSKQWVTGTMVAPKVMLASPKRAGGIKVQQELLD